MYVCSNLAEIWDTYWGSKGEYQHQFWGNLITIERVLSGFMLKAKANFCHAYKISRFEEQSKNQYASRLNIRGVPFGGYKSVELETTEI